MGVLCVGDYVAYRGGDGVFILPSPLWKGENTFLLRRCRIFLLFVRHC